MTIGHGHFCLYQKLLRTFIHHAVNNQLQRNEKENDNNNDNNDRLTAFDPGQPG